MFRVVFLRAVLNDELDYWYPHCFLADTCLTFNEFLVPHSTYFYRPNLAFTLTGNPSSVDFRAQTITVVENMTCETRAIQMNVLLTESLKSIKRQERCHWVFHDGKGNKVNDFPKPLNASLKRAEILRKIRFHDLKHTMLSWLGMESVSSMEIQSLTGHKACTYPHPKRLPT